MSDNFSDAVGDALRSVMLFLPKAVAFVAILVAGWLIAKAVLKIVEKVLERVGFDRAVERGGIRRALAAPGTTPVTSSPSSPTTRCCWSPSSSPSASGARTRSPT